MPEPHVALLRAVNVGGRGTIGMADLRALAGELGLREAATILQSGNLVFAADGTADTLQVRIEAALAERVGLSTEVFVRSLVDWAGIVSSNPFEAAARDDPSHLLVMVLAAAPAATAEDALRAAVKGREAVAVRGRAAYLLYPDGIGRSKLTSALVERHLGVRGTGRNWNTVARIAAALDTLQGTRPAT